MSPSSYEHDLIVNVHSKGVLLVRLFYDRKRTDGVVKS